MRHKFPLQLPVHQGYKVYPAGASLLSRLTPKQKIIAVLITEGKSNRQISEITHNSHQVIKNRVGEIFDRVGCDSRLQLAVLLVNETMYLSNEVVCQ